MINKLYPPIFICFFILTNNSFSQNIKNIDSSYNEYFSAEREIPYLHLNKTNFIIGEEIWFKSYVFNLNNKKLNSNTNNLYVSLYNKNGKIKQKKLIYIENGIGAGSIKIDSTFKEKEYYLTANTNWMKNFNEDNSYFQRINIIQGGEKIKKEINKKYDVQFLPESGHLIESIKNTLGIIVKDTDNKGVKIKEGRIFDNEKKVVAIFKNNGFGIGSVDFIYETDKKYNAELILFDGSKIKKSISVAKKKGVTLSIYNPHSTFISIFIKTNKYTLPDLINKEYKLLIHNTNKTIKQVFSFNEKALEYSINLNSNKLDNGVNIITLFNEKNTPIAERLFFNYNKNKFKKPKLFLTKNGSDSLLVTIKKSRINNAAYYLSASTLPESTKSNKQESNIVSKLLVEPYINGKIENPNYYFRDINREKLMKLDLLLLTQGWSKYKWNNIFNNTPKMIYKKEKGITISGSIVSKRKNSSIFLFSKENNLVLNAVLKNKKFKFKNLHLKEGSKINLSSKQGKKKIRQDKIYLDFSPKINFIDIKPFNFKSNYKIEEPEAKYEDFIADGISLKGFSIKTKVTKTKYKPLMIGPSKSYKIDENSQQNAQVFSFIRSKGFNVYESAGNFTIYNSRGNISFTATKPTTVYLDGQLIQDESGYNALDQIKLLSLKDFDEIIVSKTGFGIIQIFRKQVSYKKNSTNRFSEKIVPFGYSIEKEYYQPQYNSYNDNFFNHFGAINWNSRIKINGNETKTSYNILNINKKAIKIFLEGVTDKGEIIFEEKILELK